MIAAPNLATFETTELGRHSERIHELSRQAASRARQQTLIGQGAIQAGHLDVDSVTADAIAAGTITADLIAAGAITAGHIQAGAITAGHIAAGTITATEIAAGTITAGNIAAGAITTDHLAANTITASDIQAGTITATQIAAATITGALIAAGTITATNIAAGTITATQIAADTITATQIAADAITTSELAASSVTTVELLAATIVAGDIAANTITAGQIAASTITGSLIAAGTITATNIAAGTITGALIAAGTITGDRLVTGTITATQISVSSLSAISANLGTITAGTITGALFRSAASGQRFEAGGAGIIGYNAAGDVTFAWDTATGRVTTLAGIGGPNLQRQSSFETAEFSSVWSQETPLTWLRDPQPFNGDKFPIHGVHALRLTKTVDAGDLTISNAGGRAPVAAGLRYTVSGYFMANSAGRACQIRVLFYNAAGVDVGSTTTSPPVSDVTSGWVRASVTATAPALATSLRVIPDILDVNTGEIHWVDAFQVEQGDLLTAYGPAPDEILPNAVGSTEIAGGAVTGGGGTGEIAGGTIIGTDLIVDAITAREIAASVITAVEIAANTITSGNILAGTIEAADIAAGTITGDRIAGGTITGSLIVGDTITGSHIAANTITAGEIAANTITASQIAAASITSLEIASRTIQAGDIAVGTLTATEIATGTITADRMNVTSLSAITANMGTLTAGTIEGATIRTSGNNPRIEMNSTEFFKTNSDGTKTVRITPTDGLDLLASTTFPGANDQMLRWLDPAGSGQTMTRVFGNSPNPGSGTDRSASLYLQALSKGTNTNAFATARLEARGPDFATDPFAHIDLQSGTGGDSTIRARAGKFDGANADKLLLSSGGTSDWAFAASDVRQKQRIGPLSEVVPAGTALARVGGLTARTFDWLPGRGPVGRHVGLIAQEVEEVFPYAVFGDEEKSVQPAPLIALMVEAIKELAERTSAPAPDLSLARLVGKLDSRVAALERSAEEAAEIPKSTRPKGVR